MKSFLVRWIVTAIGVAVATRVVEGISADSFSMLIFTALLLGIFNAVLRPIMMILTLPLMILSLGLFTLVINAILFYLVAWVVAGFHVDGFWAAFKGAFIVSVISFFASMLMGKDKKDAGQTPGPRTARTPPRTNPPTPPPGKGPVIDV